MSDLPERDTTIPTAQQGLFRKFDVRRTDGSDAPGGKHHGCRYFVLDMDHDPYARVALSAYADVCALTHPKLARDIREKWGIRAYLAASGEVAHQPAQVAVKPLEWRSEPPYHVARVFRGHYSIERVDADTTRFVLRGTFIRNDYSTIAEAKAAAQADYETRIRSALAPSPADGAVEALEAASHFIRDHYEPGIDSEYTLLQQVNAALATLKGDTP